VSSDNGQEHVAVASGVRAVKYLPITEVRTVSSSLSNGQAIAEVGIGKVLPGPRITARASAGPSWYDIVGVALVAFIRPSALLVARLARVEIGLDRIVGADQLLYPVVRNVCEVKLKRTDLGE